MSPQTQPAGELTLPYNIQDNCHNVDFLISPDLKRPQLGLPPHP